MNDLSSEVMKIKDDPHRLKRDLSRVLLLDDAPKPSVEMVPVGPQIAAKFIADVFGATTIMPVHVCVLANDRGNTEELPFRKTSNRDTTAIEHFVTRFDEPGRAIYFCVGTIKEGATARNKQNVAEISFLFTDIDFKDIDDTRADVERKLAKLKYPPSYTVFTGHGIHAYWLLTESVDPQADGMMDQIEGDLKRLADLVGGDTQVCEIARLMRMPGSQNTKFEGESIPVEVLTSNGKRYELSDLQDWLGEQSPVILRKERERGITAGQAVEKDPFAEYGASFKPPLDVKKRLDGMMYMGGGEADVHATQLSVTASMLNSGHDIEEVVGLVLAATKAASGDYGKRWNWRIEEKSIRKMCEKWLNKLALEGKTPKPFRLDEAREIIAAAQDGTIITQDGIAQIFAQRHDGRLRYCHDAGAWYEWTGSHWKKDEKAKAFQFVRELGRELTDDPKVPRVKEVRSVTFAGGVERFAKGDPVFAVTSADWDRDFFLLGTPAGTVDLYTGQLREPDPADGITKVTLVAPSEKAECPLWLKFLNETFGDDDAMIRFLQQWAGYCLTGDIREHALLFGTGDGGNGKGVFLHTIAGIMQDYAVAATMQTFTASTQERHSTELAMLRGARMVTASETEKGRAWAEARIKQLTGGDPITCRFMRQDDFTYIPQFKLTIIGNHKPQLQNVDAAARRRLNIIPFNNKPAVVDRELESKLMGEAPAILRWMIDGCVDWSENGLVRPQSVIDATDDYFSDQDSFTHWLDECCDCDPGNTYKSATAAELYQSWKAHALAAGEDPESQKSFADRLLTAGKGIVAKRTTKGMTYKGIRLLAVASSHNETEDDRASDGGRTNFPPNQNGR
jgi:putative DNA primase/helicase